MAAQAQEAIKDETPNTMFAKIARAAQTWDTVSDIEIMNVKARIDKLQKTLYRRPKGPVDIMQANLQPYPPTFLCECYLTDTDEAEFFATQAPPALPADISDDDILAIFQEMPISFMLQNRNDDTQVRFIKLWISDGNVDVVMDYERWDSDAMDCETSDDEDIDDGENNDPVLDDNHHILAARHANDWANRLLPNDNDDD